MSEWPGDVCVCRNGLEICACVGMAWRSVRVSEWPRDVCVCPNLTETEAGIFT